MAGEPCGTALVGPCVVLCDNRLLASSKEGRLPDRDLRTVVRCRPLRTEEEQDPGFDLDLDRVLVSVRLREFLCSDIFDESVSQAEVFERLGRDLTQHVLEGYNATVLCYGEGGAGKSYTLFGPSPDLAHAAAEQGLAPRAFRYVFRRLRALRAIDWQVSLSMREIAPLHDVQALVKASMYRQV
eukprot:s147_g3.t2